MTNIADKIASAFNTTKIVIEETCDMLKELSTPLAVVLWLVLASVPIIWCLAIVRGLLIALGAI